MDARLPAGLEVAALVRQVQAAGGFPAVLRRGDAEAGTILVVIAQNGRNARVYERMPLADGSRKWHCARRENPENAEELVKWLDRRKAQDADLWIVELDIADGERFIGLTPDES